MPTVWDVDPKLFAADIDSSIESTTLRVANKVFDGVVGLTPVIKGHLRDSWRMSVNEVDTSTTSGGGTAGSPLGKPLRPVISVKPGDKVIISNSLGYANDVENGGPRNAPRGMVAATIAGL